MSARFFLDTNVFVYTFDGTAATKAKKAAQLIRKAADTGEGVVSNKLCRSFSMLRSAGSPRQ